MRRMPLMKKTFLITLILFLVQGWNLPLGSKTITLIHSNDTHGTYKPNEIRWDDQVRLVGGMESVSHYINAVRESEKDIMLIDLGDILTGTLAVEIRYQGVVGGAMIEFLNRLGYEVWCYGNHEFDRGQQTALGLSKLADFPTVMSNLVYKKNNQLFPAEPYHIFDKAGLKVGIIAVMEEDFLLEVQKEYVEGLDVLPIIPTLNSYIPGMDKRSDLIIVLFHGPFEEGLRIAERVGGIDVILVASEDGKFEETNGVLVKSTLGHQRTLGYLKLEVKDDRVVSYEEKLIWLWADVCLDPLPQVSALVKEIDAAIQSDYARVIGEAKKDLNKRDYPMGNASVEMALGNWITDVMRWKTGAQIGLHNSGGIRAGILAGPITREDVFNVSPFHSTLVLFELTGQQLKDMLERDVERGMDRLQVSGLRYRFYPKQSRPYGKRITSIEIDEDVLVKEGEVIFPKKVYTVVSNNYVVGHAEDKFLGFPVEQTKDTGFILYQVLMEWLERHKVLDHSIEGRIAEINLD
jgi:5'-nucleotidase/UDP-sugar diphosphatase